MKVKIKMANTLVNQEKARKIRDANLQSNPPLRIFFSEDFTDIFFEGKTIHIPDKQLIDSMIVLEGTAKKEKNDWIIQPSNKGKTVNLHLDADLAAELNEIRQHILNKTQHDLLLDIFKKGMDYYK